MTVCPSCGRESPADFAFCPGCGARLISEPKPLAEERKVVTTLCCDLVSYTAHSESADHELIDELLRRYNALARRLVEGHGGVVEKFIGDAVLAVFGFPAAHDDDAERAVRCALKLAVAAGELGWPGGDPVQVRIGVNTGETYVHTGVDPASGETFLTGDAVNTAARLQTAAPVSTVVVGELTQRLSAAAIAYDELAPLAVKGKLEPVRAWLATGVGEGRSRTGLRTTGALDTPFLGRAPELRRLLGAFDAAGGARQAQFVLLVGEPGIGKSRLVLVLARTLEASPELITWRQGRCLPYGEGVSFSALAEILKAHAGILDSDDVAAVEAKLEAVLPEGADRPWLRQRLRPLLGLEASQASREESFAAWRLFLGRIASSGPTVLVLEDLHWADEGMLAFVDNLVAHGLSSQLLVLGTTRPELLQRHPDVLSSTDAVTRVTLSPLRRKDAARLVSALLDERLAAAVRGPILERIGGNPLYAEEYVRLLVDRGLLLKTSGVLQLTEGAELPLPDSVQAVLAARLDTLSPEHKALLCDAAVFGQSFSCGGVAALAGRGSEYVLAAMLALAERQLVRAVVTSSLAGETEYLFWHALARDVAYAELPMRARADKHAAAAGWLEAKTGERAGDLAEVLAHHYVAALELAEALGDTPLRESFVEPAVRTLALAGDRALRLDVVAALNAFRRALELSPEYGVPRARLMLSLGMALFMHGDVRESAPVLETAAHDFEIEGELRLAARCCRWLVSAQSLLCDPREAATVARAAELLQGQGPCEERAEALRLQGGMLWGHGDPEEGARVLDEAVSMYQAVGIEEPIDALGSRGGARCAAGDLGGREDYMRALTAAQSLGLGREVTLLWVNYLDDMLWIEGPEATLAASREVYEFAHRRGIEGHARAIRTMTVFSLAWVGQWYLALREAAAKQALGELGDDRWDLAQVRSTQVLVKTWRGARADGEVAVLLDLAEVAAAESVPPYIASRCYLPAAVAMCRDDVAAAARLVEKWAAMPPAGGNSGYSGVFVPGAARVALAAADGRLIERLAGTIRTELPLDQHARVTTLALRREALKEPEAAAAGFADAASRWHGFGVPYEEGHALFGQGRCLAALGRAPEAAAPLAAAREIFARLGAKPALAETDALLAVVSG